MCQRPGDDRSSMFAAVAEPKRRGDLHLGLQHVAAVRGDHLPSLHAAEHLSVTASRDAGPLRLAHGRIAAVAAHTKRSFAAIELHRLRWARPTSCGRESRSAPCHR